MERIPATFWGVVAGSFFTLLGVYFTNRSNNRRQEAQLRQDRQIKAAQLEHDRESNTREREMAFRKEVFTEVAEAIFAGMSGVMEHADLSVPANLVTADFFKKAPAIGKAHLIAGEKTVRAISELMTAFESTFLRLSIRRARMVDIREAIRIREEIIAKLGPERALRKRLITQQEEIKEQFRIAYIGFAKQCCEEAMQLGKIFPGTLIAAREELDTSMHLGVYAEILEAARQKTQTHLEAFFKDLDRK